MTRTHLLLHSVDSLLFHFLLDPLSPVLIICKWMGYVLSLEGGQAVRRGKEGKRRKRERDDDLLCPHRGHEQHL